MYNFEHIFGHNFIFSGMQMQITLTVTGTIADDKI